MQKSNEESTSDITDNSEINVSMATVNSTIKATNSTLEKLTDQLKDPINESVVIPQNAAITESIIPEVSKEVI